MCMGAPQTPSMNAVPPSSCTQKSLGCIPALTDGGMNRRGAVINIVIRLTADNLLHELITCGERTGCATRQESDPVWIQP